MRYIIFASMYSRIHTLVKMPIYREAFGCSNFETLEFEVDRLTNDGWEIDKILTVEEAE